jgi:tetratricopeptide (TPR) repeat protein
MAPALHSSGEPIEAVVSLLRAELVLEQDPTQQAMARHEIAVLEEARGEIAAAERDYFAALEGAPDFGEPLEALLRLVGKRRDDPALARLLETACERAATPADAARALWELSAYRQDVLADRDAARAALEQAVEADRSDATAWLELELLAAESGDAALRLRALEARTRLVGDAAWQGLLLLDVARLAAEQGEHERAATLCDEAAALEGPARFLSRLALERIAEQSGDAELRAHALEGQAELLAEGAANAEAAAESGAPRFLCRPEAAAEAWLRAGELRRRAGDGWGAMAALSSAADRLGDHPLVARLRVAAADAAGEVSGAGDIVREQLRRGVRGPVAASLWLRLAELAEAGRDLGAALEAYGKAIEMDPSSIVAPTLRVDALARGDDGAALADALEAEAERLGSDAARARAWMVIAYVRAVRATDVAAARRALEQAARLGAPSTTVLRLARCLASLCHAERWYEEATEALLAAATDLADQAALSFELGRARLLRGDERGALEAFTMLADGAGGWLGRALASFAVGSGAAARAAGARGAEPADPDATGETSVPAGGGAPRDATLLAELGACDPDPVLGRGLVLVAALWAARQGRRDDALRLAAREHEREPADVAVALCLAGLRRASDPVAAAEVLVRTAGAIADRECAGALELEAALLLWRAGERERAVATVELALDHTPEAARRLLAWALRGASADDRDARNRVLEIEEGAANGGPAAALAALERLGIALGAERKEGGEVRGAADVLEEAAAGRANLANAARLGRLLGDDGDDDPSEALAALETLDGTARALAWAERYRRARFVAQNEAASAEAARGWARAEPCIATCLEWLATSLAVDDREQELGARLALAAELGGETGEQVAASATAFALLGVPGERAAIGRGRSDAARLAALELAPLGCDPRRRAAALAGVGETLGAEAALDALALAGWSELARGDARAAQRIFRELTERQANDVAAWEGYRAASEKLGDWVACALACAQLGARSRSDARGAELWETAGLVLLEHTKAHEDAEIALERALERDPRRVRAFDKLFRRVRARNEDDRLLKLIKRRLEIADSEAEITKLYWERARVLRRKGDHDGAIKALRDVTLLEPDHVGALALLGEIHITRSDFAEAAPLLARLAAHEKADEQQRLMSGVAAADLFEKKLGEPKRALEVLVALHKSGLAPAKLRERLARAAAKLGAWEEAVTVLEGLMEERASPEGRAEAARLAMAICRDKLARADRAAPACERLLRELPDDPEALELLLGSSAPALGELRRRALPRAKQLILERLGREPCDAARVRLAGAIARGEGQLDLERAALGVLEALLPSPETRRAAATLDARVAPVPKFVIDAKAVLQIADPEDRGALPELFALLAATLSAALGPSLRSEGVGKKERLDKGELRIEVSRWVGALGFDDFELYVGGRDARGVRGVAGELPTLVVGPGVTTPLDVAARTAVAREVFALRRGTTAVMHYDDATVASIVAAVSNEVEVAVPEPPFAVYREVERAVRKAVPRKLKKPCAALCARLLEHKTDAGAWAAAARRSADRMALVASGDAAVVIEQIVGAPGTAGRLAMDTNTRAKRLLSFALSKEYLELRHGLGMGVE